MARWFTPLSVSDTPLSVKAPSLYKAFMIILFAVNQGVIKTPRGTLQGLFGGVALAHSCLCMEYLCCGPEN